MTEPAPINGPYEFTGVQVYDWAATLTVKAELFVEQDDGRIIYANETKSALKIFEHFVGLLAEYITEGDGNARDSHAQLRNQFGVGP